MKIPTQFASLEAQDTVKKRGLDIICVPGFTKGITENLLSNHDFDDLRLRFAMASDLSDVHGWMLLNRYVKRPFHEDAEFDHKSFQLDIIVAHCFMDFVITSRHKLEDGQPRSLGFGGLSDALAMLNIEYDSVEGLRFVSDITFHLAWYSYVASSHLAEKRQPAVPCMSEPVKIFEELAKRMHLSPEEAMDQKIKHSKTGSRFHLTPLKIFPPWMGRICNFSSHSLSPIPAKFEDDGNPAYSYNWLEFVTYFYGQTLPRIDLFEEYASISFFNRAQSLDLAVYQGKSTYEGPQHCKAPSQLKDDLKNTSLIYTALYNRFS